MTLLGEITLAQVLGMPAIVGLLLVLGIVNFRRHRGAGAAGQSDLRR